MVYYSSYNDPKELLARAKQGDHTAFGELYEMYFTSVFRYIYFRVRSRPEAEDLTQVVFVKAFEAMPRFTEQGRSPLAFFFTIARNTVINFWRKKREVLPRDPEEFFATLVSNQATPEEIVSRAEQFSNVKLVIQSLTDEQQEVITLRFMGELSNREIAGMLGKSEDAVRQLQCRGLKALRDYFKTDETRA